MIHKILNKLKGSSEFPKTPIEEVVEKIKSIRLNSETLAICANNTGNNWLGIKRGTEALFPSSTLILDQYYSNPVYNKEELRILAESISKSNFSKIFFRGFPSYFENIIDFLNELGVKQIWILFAGPVSEFNNEKKRDSFANLISIAQNNKIEGIGFNKQGMAEAISKLYRIKAEHYINKSPILSSNISKPLQGLNIGVFSGNTFNKNKHTQAISALLIDKSNVHVFNKDEFNYLPNTNRIIGIQSGLEHDQFITKLSQMTINSYLAFSESWGNVILESAAVGVPCLTTANNGVYFLNPTLEEKLVVKNYDDVTAIAKQMSSVIEERLSLKQDLLKYGEVINEYADHLLTKNFL